MEESLPMEHDGNVDASGQTVKGTTNISARYAMGAVTGYWRLNSGSAFGLNFWETKLKETIGDLHVQDVIEMCKAFRENRTHHRDHLKDMLKEMLKPVVLEKWAAEVEYQ